MNLYPLGGIGRHDRLKICCFKRVGSSPTEGTNINEKKDNV